MIIKLFNFEIFCKFPADLRHATRRGGVLPITVAPVIGLVLFCEARTYIEGEIKSQIVLDTSRESQVGINFDITFFKLLCRFANIEVQDYLDTAKLDASSQARKTVIGGERGEEHKRDYRHIGNTVIENVDHQELAHVPEEIVHLSASNYDLYLKQNEYTFIMYYVEWCMHSRNALPEWSKLAKFLPGERPNVKVAKVDCVKDPQICEATKITGYPTIKMFKGVNLLEEYRAGRKVEYLTDYVKKVF